VTRHADEFTAFVRSHGRRLQRFGYLLTGDAALAEDLVQTALLQALRHWDRIENREGIEAYVRKIMINKQRALWRRRAGHEILRGELLDTSVADKTGHVDDHDVLQRALRQLPARQRAVVILRFYEDLSEAEAATVLGCSVGTVKSQTSRGLAKLRVLVTPAIEGASHVVR
jgi:RNA polymerase sigma-70 factor (sigma-E family)